MSRFRAGGGSLGEYEAPRHACRVDGQPASVRALVRQGTRLVDEGAQFSPDYSRLGPKVG